jgi:hypothetical protein
MDHASYRSAFGRDIVMLQENTQFAEQSRSSWAWFDG